MYRVTLSESLFLATGGDRPPAVTIGEMLRRSANANPAQMALRELLFDGTIGREWTYAALLEDAERLARALSTRHDEGARIAVYANNCPEWVLLELACGLAGVTLATVNPSYQKSELAYVLSQSRSEAIYYVAEFRGNPMAQIVDDACAEASNVSRRILLTDHKALYDGEHEGELRKPKPNDPVQIQYTSGTTGFPKGAMLHHDGLIQNGVDLLQRGGVRDGSVMLQNMPLFHTTGCAIQILGGFALGATILLAPIFDPAMLADVIERERPSFGLAVPTMVIALLDEAEKSGRDLSSFAGFQSGGSMVAPELVRRFRDAAGVPIQIIYGQTEASPAITAAWPDDAPEDLSETIGQPLPFMDVAIFDAATGEILPIDAQGEICVRGYNVMIGYNDNPAATAAAIDERGWLHTGDLGSMDSRGYVRITGRVKEMIIRGGENLFPAEIENAMLEHDAVAEVAVVGVPDEKWGEQVACFMRAVDGAPTPDATALKAFIRERLSPQKTPAYWLWIEDWPLTGSGKIQKFKLREAYEAGAFADRAAS